MHLHLIKLEHTAEIILEIPCLLKFIAKGENEATKAKGLLEFALSTTSVESSVL